MRESLSALCKEFIENRDIVKSVFSWDNSYVYPVCAAVFMDKRKKADAETLEKSKAILKKHTGVFSNFRNTVRPAMVSMMAVEEDPEKKLQKALQIYEELKEYFWGSEYLPVAAMMLADMVEPENYKEVAARTRHIYMLMKDEHPFLTSSEDSVLAALLALTKKSDEEIVAETESCYQNLKNEFFSGNAVQSLSHVLALCDGAAEVKCQKVMELFGILKENGRKYGTSYELATLGVLAMLPANLKTIAEDVLAVDEFLAEQKGYGILGPGKAQRLMHAAMIVTSDYMAQENNGLMNSAALGSVVSLVVAQQAAMCAAIAASSAAAASNAGN